jgi:Domain of unknown function (DUF4440)
MNTSASSAVEQAVESLLNAMLQADGPTLEALAADDLSYGHSNAKLDDRATFLKKLSGEIPAFSGISITDQSIRISGPTAVVRHNFSAVASDVGMVNLHILMIWVEQNGTWKLLARQATKLP